MHRHRWFTRWRNGAWGTGESHSDEEIWAVLAYIKSSWPDKIREAQLEMTRNAARR